MPKYITQKSAHFCKTVEAHQFDGTWFNGRFLSQWAQNPGVIWDDFTMVVQTPAGEMVAKKHDWITRNEALEFGVVARLDFEANYRSED